MMACTHESNSACAPPLWMKPHLRFTALGLAFVWLACHAITIGLRGEDKALNGTPPPIPREFRGVWVATVGNRDWPSAPGLPVAEQKAELVAILAKAAQLNLNAVIFQVRPACDALYASRLEPWSEYLSGQMGRAPEPNYDPLALAIEQAHLRGLELHAWFNPFRARYRGAKSSAAKSHITRTHPELIRKCGQFLWLDPGERAVQAHTQTVILDVVKRYDVDGVHLDDYFYPYPEKDSSGKLLPFADDATWRRCRAAGGKLNRADWRRKNVDDFIQIIYRGIKAEKPWVKFGLSPFGIWRPGYPKQVIGLDAFDTLYADSRKWMTNGWADYFAPQLYWSIQSEGQSYPVLLKWWVEQNSKGRHLWPGNNAAKVGADWKADEIVNQIRLTRKQPGATGNTLWNASSLRNTNGLAEALTKSLYGQSALVPASPWLDGQPPGKPKLSVQQIAAVKELNLSWQATGPETVWLWVLQTRSGNQWTTEVLPGHTTVRVMKRDSARRWPEYIAVIAVDRCGNTSAPALARAESAGSDTSFKK